MQVIEMRPAVMLAVVLVVTSCTKAVHRRIERPTDSNSTSVKAATIRLADATIRGIGLGTLQPQVIAALGIPSERSRSTYSELLGDTIRTWKYAGMTLQLYDRRVGLVDCFIHCRTPAGLDVGISVARVLTTLGKPASPIPGHEQDPLYLIDSLDCWLRFEIEHAVVIGLHLECDES